MLRIINDVLGLVALILIVLLFVFNWRKKLQYDLVAKIKVQLTLLSLLSFLYIIKIALAVMLDEFIVESIIVAIIWILCTKVCFSSLRNVQRVERFVDAMNGMNNEIIDVEFSEIKDN